MVISLFTLILKKIGFLVKFLNVNVLIIASLCFGWDKNLGVFLNLCSIFVNKLF